MNKILLIIRREYLTRVKKKSFIVMTILGPLLLAGVMGIMIWLSLAETDDQRMLIADETPGLYKSLANMSNKQLEVTYANVSLEEGKKLFAASEYTSMLWIPMPSVETPQNKVVKLLFRKQPSNRVQESIEEKIESILVRMMVKRLVDSSEIDTSAFDVELFRSVKSHVSIDLVKFKDDGEEEAVDKINAIPGFGFGLLIYFFVMLFGVQVMRGVIEEKTSRIVEVIISSVKPFHLMLGKIVGIWLVSLTQFLLWVALSGILSMLVTTAIVSATYDGAEVAAQYSQMTPEMAQQFSKEMPSGPVLESEILSKVLGIPWGYLIGLFLFFFSGGYLLYAALFAAVGSAVDSETDTQQFMMPVTLPLILGYVVSLMVLENPDGPAAFWFSIIPLTSPIVMMVRASMGSVPLWELLLSMTLLVGTFLLMTMLAGRIYRTGILMYGKKASFRELLKWVTYKG